jgi:hypothetical protein
MEELQIMKFIFRGERLNFTEDLICTEHELSVLDLSSITVDYLLETGKIDELKKYIDESWEGWGKEKYSDL